VGIYILEQFQLRTKAWMAERSNFSQSNVFDLEQKPAQVASATNNQQLTLTTPSPIRDEHGCALDAA
jgi:hypothetical protein